MENIKESIEEIKEILFLIREYGASKYFKYHPGENTIFDYDEFFGFANEGIKSAQSILLDKLRANLKEQESLNKNLKDLRRIAPKDKGTIDSIKEKLKFKEWQERNYRGLVNAIVWQLFGGHREIIARFHLEEGGSKSLFGEGFEATILAAEEINKDPLKFALIADLSSNVHVGDLVIWTKKGFELREVKTGTINKQAHDLLKFYEVNNIDPSERIELMNESHFKNQLKRMLKQKQTMKKTATIINNDSGEYQKDANTKVLLKESFFVEETFDEKIIELYLSLNEDKRWAYTNIEEIVNIGLYRDEWREGIGKHTLTTINKDFPIFDLRQGLGIGITQNLFSKPYPTEMISDIMAGKVQVLIGINYEELIKYANNAGLPLRWSTKKELNDFRRHLSFPSNEIFEFENKGLVIAEGELKAFVGMGFLSRILFDSKTPQIQLMNRLKTWQQLKSEANSKKA